MNEYINQPFAQNMHQVDVADFAEISPIVKLWAFRFLVELGGAKEFISDHCFSHQWIAKKLGFSEALLADKFDEQAAYQELNHLHKNSQQQNLLDNFQFNAELQYNLKLIQQLLDLNAVESTILGFIVMLNSEQLLDDIADTIGELTASKTIRALAVGFDLPDEAIRQVGRLCLYKGVYIAVA